jgi:WG containing repeat
MTKSYFNIRLVISLFIAAIFTSAPLSGQSHYIFEINDAFYGNNSWLMNEKGDTLLNDSAEVYFYCDSILISRRAGYYRFWDWNFSHLLTDSIEEINCDQSVYPSFIIAKRKGKWGYYNSHNGKLIIKHQFDEASEFYEGIALVQKGGKYQYITTTGTIMKYVTPEVRNHYNEWGTMQLESIESMTIPRFRFPGLILVRREETFGIKDSTTGNWILPLVYNKIIGNHGSYVIVHKDFYYGIYNLEARHFVTECKHFYIRLVER